MSASTTTNPCQIYLITPPQIMNLKAFCVSLHEALSSASVACLQIRLKNMNGDPAENSAIIQAAQAIKPICHKYGTLLLINDSPELAIFHPENCLEGMQLLASPAITPKNWPLKRLHLAPITWPLERFLKQIPKPPNIAQTWRF